MPTIRHSNSQRPKFWTRTKRGEISWSAPTGYRFVWRILKPLLTLCYSSFFIYAVFFARRRRSLTERILNPVPVINSVEQFLNLSFQDTKEAVAFAANLFGNIALFVPLPFLLISFLRIRALPNALLASFILSLSVEAIQFFFKRGVADVDDVLLNVLGAWAGYGLYVKLFGYPATAEA